MKKGRFTEEQIIGVVKQHEAGRKVPSLELWIWIYDHVSKRHGMQ